MVSSDVIDVGQCLDHVAVFHDATEECTCFFVEYGMFSMGYDVAFEPAISVVDPVDLLGDQATTLCPR